MHKPVDLTDTAAFETQLDRWRGRIGEAVAEAMAFGTTVPAPLQAGMSHAVLAGGKRYRGMLVLALGSDLGVPEEQLLSSAVAIETIHAASLVVDDLPCMDDARRRRSQPATHVAFGEATAILSSIALIARAMEVVARDRQLSPASRSSIVDTLSHAIGPQALCGGQYDDLYPPYYATEQDLIHRYQRKTSALFVAAFRCPALLAEVDPETLLRIARAGQRLGVAFQIFDDLLDLTGDAHAIGKDVGQDHGTVTLATLLGPARAAERAADELAAVQKELRETVGPGRALDLIRRMAARIAGTGKKSAGRDDLRPHAG
ncbi:Geranylgeranyl pyrophosphate synthetase (GGPP synthetase) (Farnesyltranstransferase) [Bradyrhizobium sp. ORS 278]|uniref:polyprenyl synthetase family protein n=1 Tax=Bradyrhizobium sp. (strain ORS 278) TaxID=114615 RepID=UPI00000B4901|nr:polyprenyl synthetase family protein [Bradyrhizobium sp. ORS 278]AAF78199.1 geranylgeranyl synthase [Bradyrhizobium sp. ORS 278]CAL80121.1 Geranylgeranyl pyrophosphate synthetase (GGPP synthetase) (Farnesyltranstransferase) [Bradyrhizobium sp. ORS 278]